MTACVISYMYSDILKELLFSGLLQK